MGKGFGFWKTMPICFLERHDVDVLVVDVLALERQACRSRGRSGMRSFMRFRQRRNVDLPQPEGPMMAVMLFALMPMLMCFRAGILP